MQGYVYKIPDELDLCHCCSYKVVARGKMLSFSLECHFSLTTEHAQALWLIFMSGVWTLIWYEKNIFMMKESCKSYVLETKSEIETAFAEKFPSVVLSFPKGSDGSHFVLVLLKWEWTDYPSGVIFIYMSIV